MFELLDAVAACLDRDSARRVNKIQVEHIVGKRLQELRDAERHGTLSREKDAELALLVVALNFVSHLQRKARAILRQPARSITPAKKK